MASKIVAASLTLLLFVSSSLLGAESAILNSALSTIKSSDLKQHVDVLADDSFEGREAGTRGGRAAGMYILKHFEQQGLKPAGDNGGYFQMFDNGYRNILGLLEGSDPNLRDEVIVICAHYDHVGYGTRSNSFGPFGYVHNGADDNASGVAGLLEAVDAFVSLPTPPRRSVLFALWDGEEKGLLGSKHWVAIPTIDFDRVVFAINVDMIGRMEEGKLEAYGSRTSIGLRRMISERNEDPTVKVNFKWEMKANSDHYPFFENGIPVLMFHTGLHDDYHRPSDDAHLINAQGMERASRLLFTIAFELSNADLAMPYRAAATNDTPYVKEQLESPLASMQPRFGVSWQPNEEGILKLVRVTPGMPGDNAGLQVGDVIVRFDGRNVKDSDSFRQAVMFAHSPTEVVIRREGEEEEQTLEVELAGKPTRIGLSWRDDVVEPGTAVVTRVVPGSPAALSGLKLGDRIYDVNSRPFADTTELFDMLVNLPGPISMSVEANGQLREIVLDVPPPLKPNTLAAE